MRRQDKEMICLLSFPQPKEANGGGAQMPTVPKSIEWEEKKMRYRTLKEMTQRAKTK